MANSWRLVNDEGHMCWQYIGRHGVYGTVTLAEDGKFIWSARVMLDCRLPNCGSPPPQGKALTIEGAKCVVELLCDVTGTGRTQ
jgi:hypothetical protein